MQGTYRLPRTSSSRSSKMEDFEESLTGSDFIYPKWSKGKKEDDASQAGSSSLSESVFDQGRRPVFSSRPPIYEGIHVIELHAFHSIPA